MQLNQLALCGLALCTAHAAADVSVFTDQDLFHAQTGALTIETFENETLGELALPAVFTSGLTAEIVSGDVASMIEAGNPDSFGFQNTTEGGRKYLRFGQVLDTGSYSVEFTFGMSANAFGFNLSGFQPSDAAGGFNVSIFSNGQLTEDFFVPSDQPFPGVGFYGFVSSSDFDAIRINLPVLNNLSNADYVAFDDVAWGVPTPSALSLLGMAGLCLSKRRR